MMITPQERGRRGETLSEKYLLDKGYAVIARNWRFRHFEIDIIALKDKTIHFVEVKSLQYPNLTEPYNKVDRKKRLRIISAANGFLNSREWGESAFRLGVADAAGAVREDAAGAGGAEVCYDVCFDIVSVIFKNNNILIEFFENAYSPQW